MRNCRNRTSSVNTLTTCISSTSDGSDSADDTINSIEAYSSPLLLSLASYQKSFDFWVIYDGCRPIVHGVGVVHAGMCLF